MSKKRRSTTECLKKSVTDLTPWEKSRVARMKRRAKDPVVQHRAKAHVSTTVVED